MAEPVKMCTRCLRRLALSAFGIERRAPDGLKHSCRDCCSDRMRERRSIPEGLAASLDANR